MAVQAGLVRCLKKSSSDRYRDVVRMGITVALVGAFGNLVFAASPFDGYAGADQVVGVVVGEEGLPAAASESWHQDAQGYAVTDASSGYCHEQACRGCRHCQGRSGAAPGLINRVLGDACPRWVGQIDALMLWQGNVPATPLLLVNDGSSNPPTAVDANDLSPGISVGPRAALLFNFNREYAIEANYLYVGSINAEQAFEAPFPNQLVWDDLAGIAQFGNIDDGAVSTNGSIQSFELNWRHRHCGHPLTWLVGFRWVEWNQNLTISDAYNDGLGSGQDLLDVDTENDLYGVQFGLDALLLDLWQTIRFNGVAKAGVYGNAAATSVFVDSDRSAQFPVGFAGTRDLTGFFGEIGINGAVRLTNHVFWRAGYNFFWISGVALPVQQLSSVDVTEVPPQGKIEGGGSVFLNGVNTGIEVVW